ncbi:hypothetical protein ABZU78_16130 [Rhodococcus erythropolis]|uniref:hypothetical protein n=1 Tax=Rhodococcus erythropolis TaxID=1833 RepID=UPI0033BAC66B
MSRNSVWALTFIRSRVKEVPGRCAGSGRHAHVLRVGVVVEGAADDAYQTDGMIGLGCGACSYNTG